MIDQTVETAPADRFGLLRLALLIRRHKIVFALVVIALLLGVWWLARPGANVSALYRSTPVEHGPITKLVTATGTLNAVISVDIGAQVTGLVSELHADFNSEVKAGQVLAVIDPMPYQAALKAAQAQLELAKATVLERKADIQSAIATRDNAKLDLDRKRSLTPRGFETHANLDQAEATYRSDEARVASSQAALAEAEAQVQQNQAQVDTTQLNLDHTTIHSSVDGTVVNRAVDIGQTVTAGFQTPVMFTVAKDLHEMQLQVSVDEADVGQLKVGQEASFTVDSFPGERFRGKVEQIRLNPKSVQNVVTYVVIVTADNPDLRLFPGMTANVTISVAHRDDAIKVPNAALRFRPQLRPDELIELRQQMQAAQKGALTPDQQYGAVWIVSGGKPKPIPVVLGLSDAASTEIVRGAVKAGDQVLVGSAAPDAAGGGFGPPPGGGFRGP